MGITLPQNIQSRPVTVVGGGTLGSRIALMFTTQGGKVRLYDPSEEARQHAVDFVAENSADTVALVDGGVAGSLETGDDLAEALKGSWLAVEAVPEHLDLKKKVFGQLDELSENDTILASNSSSYPTSSMIDNVATPERVVNMHFYMPPAVRVVELMSDGQTDQRVLDLLLDTLPGYGLYPFEAYKQSTGFIFNRIWAAIKRECLSVVAEGVSTPQDVDRIWELALGTGPGPFRLMDQVGLDVVLDIENHYAKERPGLPEGPRKLLRRYVDEGRLGVKSGRGFYDDYRDN
ncbi:3-hydroxyacyl-CoA dehydrogenase family protein [Haloglycomyces albus]|uniref:3-hydroxyacyl-CoA dehydrogenase family protein n=1 Tax=Haloglycomyces albus TaxID=526067 RepID=UPI00046D0BF9|nr:3-hydroxyacyl-CoA dehydrogenase family protein [Haloglycomyces albus]